MRTHAAVLIEDGKVRSIGQATKLQAKVQQRIDLGDATLLPGFIEPHAHAIFAGVPLDVVLLHGITTIRDLGGPLQKASGGEGSIRLLTAGPILTAPGGYPIPAFSGSDLARAVVSPEEGRAAVQDLISRGASVIKIALEPGGEPGAPWMRHVHGTADGAGVKHGAGPTHPASTHSAAQAKQQSAHPLGIGPVSWPLLPAPTVKAIVDEAHRLGKRTIAHVAEERGVTIALDAGIDQWAHVPCMPISDRLLLRVSKQSVQVITTIDTLSKCPGTAQNARKLVTFGASLIYGAEIAHADVPWGVDAEELNLMLAAGMAPLDVLKAATSRSGEALGLAPLGNLVEGLSGHDGRSWGCIDQFQAPRIPGPGDFRRKGCCESVYSEFVGGYATRPLESQTRIHPTYGRSVCSPVQRQRHNIVRPFEFPAPLLPDRWRNVSCCFTSSAF